MSKQVEKIKELVAKREQARLGGGEKAIEKSTHAANTQHASASRCSSTKVRSRSTTCLEASLY